VAVCPVTGPCTTPVHLATTQLTAHSNLLSTKLLLALFPFYTISSLLFFPIFCQMSLLFPKFPPVLVWLNHLILSHPVMPLSYKY
jgi:hypothetical protein